MRGFAPSVQEEWKIGLRHALPAAIGSTLRGDRDETPLCVNAETPEMDSPSTGKYGTTAIFPEFMGMMRATLAASAGRSSARIVMVL